MENTTFNNTSLFEQAMALSNKELKDLCLQNKIDTTSALEKHEYANLLAQNQIKINTKNVVKIDECSICYDELGEKNNCTTPCGHVFCFECMMQALNRNNTCPCCRAPLREEIEEDTEDEEEEEEDEDYEKNIENENIDNTYIMASHHSEYIQNTKDAPIADPETIAKKLTEAGYDMKDIVSLWLQRIDRTKHTHGYIRNMVKEINSIIETEDTDKHDRESEEWGMEQEDTRLREINDRDVFDTYPEINLNSLFGED